MSYKALLFDLDNTLVDFSASEEAGLQKIYSLYFHEYMSVTAFHFHYHHINKALWRQAEKGETSANYIRINRFELLLKKFNLALKSEDIAEAYENCLIEEVQWYPGVKETLIELKQIHKIGIITNGLTFVQQQKYQRLQLMELCDCYFISELVGISKPHKEIFELALEKLQIEKCDTLMIGDSLSSDYLGAINTGLDFCWISSLNHSLPAGWIKPKFHITSVTKLPAVLRSTLPTRVQEFEESLL